LQAVKNLELKVNNECEALGLPPHAPLVGPEILHGIEINRLAAELARTTIWIGHIQWGVRNGFYSQPKPILRKLDTIQCRDALVDRDKNTGEDIQAAWPPAEFILGNPPFLGSGICARGGQKRVNDPPIRASVTLMLMNYSVFMAALSMGTATWWCIWIKKTADLLSSGQIRSFGLVATKSVAKGASRRPLEEICRNPSTVIFDAWTNEEWVIDGADVRVALICAGRASDGLTVTRSNRPPPT
jgi:restriction-modification enzyme MmeI-like protein